MTPAHSASYFNGVAPADSILCLSPVRWIATNSTGTMKIASSVAAFMPPKTAVPNDRQDAPPAPVAISNGVTPRMNANEVIRIGRKRSRAASNAAF